MDYQSYRDWMLRRYYRWRGARPVVKSVGWGDRARKGGPAYFTAMRVRSPGPQASQRADAGTTRLDFASAGLELVHQAALCFASVSAWRASSDECR